MSYSGNNKFFSNASGFGMTGGFVNIKQQKTDLRNEFRAKRQAVSPDDREKMDREICEAIISLASFRFADILLMYYPVKGEVNIMPVAEEAWKRGKIVAFPRCLEEKGMMEFREVSSIDELCKGKYSLAEPTDSSPLLSRSLERSICIVPGVIFDRDGYRVGYGGGYYDRFLSKYEGISVGVNYSMNIVDRVPRGKYDRYVKALVSEKGVVSVYEG